MSNDSAGLVVAVQSLWPEPQKIKIKIEHGDTSSLAKNQIVTNLASDGEYELVIPLKNRQRVPDEIGPFELKIQAGDDTQKLFVPKRYIAKSYKASNDIKLDGKLDEWRPEISLVLDGTQKILSEKGKKAWKGKNDSSLKMRSCWNDKYLYFAYEVTDNDIQRHGSPDKMYRGDCMEMFFDTNLMDDLAIGSMDADDFRINAGPPEGARFPGSAVSLRTKGVKSQAVKTPAGYNIEVAIPWNLFIKHGAGPYQGTVIGFTVNLYDRDKQDRRHAHSTFSWAEKPQWWTNTGAWDRLMLIK